MMFDLIPDTLINMIDASFAPALQFLQLCNDMLSNASLVVGAGINLSNYFSFFAYLPDAWQALVTSTLASVSLLAILYLVRSYWDMYLRIKKSSKWW